MTPIPKRVLVFVLATVTAATWALAVGWPGHLTPALAFWLAACLFGELLWVRMPVGASTVSMASATQFAALLVLPPGHAMLVAAASVVIAELWFMRKPVLRALFNGAQCVLTVGAAACAIAWLGEALRGAPVAFALPLITFTAGAVVYFVVNTVAVSAAIAVAERIPPMEAWLGNFGSRYEVLSNGALFCMGAMLAQLYASGGALATVVIVMPLLVAYEGYVRHTAKRMPVSTESQRQAA
jgi:hypothetical protein